MLCAAGGVMSYDVVYSGWGDDIMLCTAGGVMSYDVVYSEWGDDI